MLRPLKMSPLLEDRRNCHSSLPPEYRINALIYDSFAVHAGIFNQFSTISLKSLVHVVYCFRLSLFIRILNVIKQVILPRILYSVLFPLEFLFIHQSSWHRRIFLQRKVSEAVRKLFEKQKQVWYMKIYLSPTFPTKATMCNVIGISAAYDIYLISCYYWSLSFSSYPFCHHYIISFMPS